MVSIPRASPRWPTPSSTLILVVRLTAAPPLITAMCREATPVKAILMRIHSLKTFSPISSAATTHPVLMSATLTLGITTLVFHPRAERRETIWAHTAGPKPAAGAPGQALSALAPAKHQRRVISIGTGM